MMIDIGVVKMSFITDKINKLKNKKKLEKHNSDLDKLNHKSQEAYIDQQLDVAKQEELAQKKQQKQNEKVALIKESRDIVFRTYGLLKKIGIIKCKEEMSRLFDRHKSYFLVLESCENQGMSFETIKNLKDSLDQIKCNLELLLDEEDSNYTMWVRQKLNGIIEEIEKLELKILRTYYGIIT